MQPERKSPFVQLVAKPVMAGFLVLAVLFLTTLAASPALHHSVHSDANSPNHSCVVGLFAKGQLHSAPAPLILAGLVALFGGVFLLRETLSVPSADYRCSSSRAPPFCF